MKIAIGCDHGGIALKQTVVDVLEKYGCEVEDFGTYGEESVDYPDFGLAVAEAVASSKCDKGILICGTGIGISISANKVPGIRAAVCHNATTASLCSAHNNANILCFGARVVDKTVAEEMVLAWLNTPFEGGRHVGRLNKITGIEKKYSK